MNTETTTTNAAPAAIRTNIEDARKIAAVLASPSVLATLDRFDGKVINRRLWDALTAAAREENDGATFHAPSHPEYGHAAEISIQNFRTGDDGQRYVAGRIVRTVYATTDGGPRPILARTGDRLNAAEMRAQFQKGADALRARADELEEQAGRFPELLDELRKLASAARAFQERWRYEIREQARGLDNALSLLDVYRDATAADFSNCAFFYR
jgi:hypothetical protein